MALLYLVRHGETDWNRENRWQGHHDRPLSALGRSQAAAAAGRLAGERLTQVHSSDLKRAWETAQMIAEACGLDARADHALREVDVGNWAGLTRAEAKERFPEAYARRRAGGTGWDGGESYEQMGERVRAYVTRLLDGIVKDHGARQADYVLAIVRGIMNWQASRLDDYTSPIIVQMARTKPAERKRERILDDVEIRALWPHLTGTFGGMVKLLLLTGQRREKVAAKEDGVEEDGQDQAEPGQRVGQEEEDDCRGIQDPAKGQAHEAAFEIDDVR